MVQLKNFQHIFLSAISLQKFLQKKYNILNKKKQVTVWIWLIKYQICWDEKKTRKEKEKL